MIMMPDVLNFLPNMKNYVRLKCKQCISTWGTKKGQKRSTMNSIRCWMNGEQESKKVIKMWILSC